MGVVVVGNCWQLRKYPQVHHGARLRETIYGPMAALPDHALFTAVQACSENTLLEQTRLQTTV